MKVHEGHQGKEMPNGVRASSMVARSFKSSGKFCHTVFRVCKGGSSKKRTIYDNTIVPKYPWQVVGSDLCEINSEHYLIMVDYFSRYPEVIRLSTTTSGAVITSLKAVFSRHGIPEVLRTDNGPQYISQRFSEFTKCSITHTTSSPRYPQSNGQVERTVQQAVKQLLRQSAASDPYRALLNYRNTPLPWYN